MYTATVTLQYVYMYTCAYMYAATMTLHYAYMNTVHLYVF